MTKLDQLRQKIGEANPDKLKVYNECSLCHCWWGEKHYYCQNPVCVGGTMDRQTAVHGEIRLADVLLAAGVGPDRPAQITTAQLLLVVSYWNLRTDSLDAQSPETIDFLHSLLCPSKE